MRVTCRAINKHPNLSIYIVYILIYVYNRVAMVTVVVCHHGNCCYVCGVCVRPTLLTQSPGSNVTIGPLEYALLAGYVHYLLYYTSSISLVVVLYK